MADKRKLFFNLLYFELEDLRHDLEIWLGSLDEMHRQFQVSDRVFEENASTLKAELVGIKNILKDLESSWLSTLGNVQDLVQAVQEKIHQEIQERDFPKALESLTKKKLNKIANYLSEYAEYDFYDWHFQFNSEHTVLGFKIKNKLFEKQSEFQKVVIVDTYDYGHVMLIDDLIMVTDKDAFVYHEMMVHVPMAILKEAKNVLVIGGGDGGTVTELTRYKNLERIVEVEIDQVVVDAALKYFPKLSQGYHDPRVQLIIDDGVRFMAQAPEHSYDLILIDSTDPIGPGEGLFSLEFYQNCARVLKPDGILINQSESPYYPKQAHELQRAAKKLRRVFKNHYVYQMFIPTYESGHWLLGFASPSRHPYEIDEESWNTLQITTRYYSPEIHRASFILPPFVHELLNQS